ncbi:uncharacterized protein SOCE26_031430 [Sorangium cellulosum]|uniref:Secreted protein n=1 Tax=Sorangium cellulosum TaxID=56 RepID=A0A2L0EQY8_SORCE|nr:hypothetical protein [Sorangium cellulosum]AUX41721.1 uncharacterized protein SOCE26_031430 [Sorangium cellulosum]
MNATLKLFLASLFPCALVAGCFAPVEPESAQETEEPVAEAEQPLPTNEVWTIYYSDEAFSHVVGRDHLRCNGYRTKSGTKSDHFFQTSESCDDGGPAPYENCTICDYPDGTRNCITVTCPPTIVF